MKKSLIIVLCLASSALGMNKRHLRPQVKTDPNCVLHLKLYEPLMTASKVFDYSLNGHVGTLQATAALKFPGCYFDGDSDYISVPDHADFSSVGTPLSVSAWVNADDTALFPIVDKYVHTSEQEWIFGLDSSRLVYVSLYQNSTGGYIGRYYGTALTAYQGTWIHLAFTYDGGSAAGGVKIYLNGAQVDDNGYTSGAFTALEDTAALVQVGRHDINYGEGKIDDVLIYTEELSAAQVKSIYETTRWRYQK